MISQPIYGWLAAKTNNVQPCLQGSAKYLYSCTSDGCDSAQIQDCVAFCGLRKVLTTILIFPQEKNFPELYNLLSSKYKDILTFTVLISSDQISISLT